MLCHIMQIYFLSRVVNKAARGLYRTPTVLDIILRLPMLVVNNKMKLGERHIVEFIGPRNK